MPQSSVKVWADPSHDPSHNSRIVFCSSTLRMLAMGPRDMPDDEHSDQPQRLLKARNLESSKRDHRLQFRPSLVPFDRPLTLWEDFLEVPGGAIPTPDHDYTSHGEYNRRVKQMIEDFMKARELKCGCLSKKHALPVEARSHFWVGLWEHALVRTAADHLAGRFRAGRWGSPGSGSLPWRVVCRAGFFRSPHLPAENLPANWGEFAGFLAESRPIP